MTSGAIQWLISVCEKFNHCGQKQSSGLKQGRLPPIGVFNKGAVKKELRVQIIEIHYEGRVLHVTFLALIRLDNSVVPQILRTSIPGRCCAF
jgi:hypothetical protein